MSQNPSGERPASEGPAGEGDALDSVGRMVDGARGISSMVTDPIDHVRGLALDAILNNVPDVMCEPTGDETPVTDAIISSMMPGTGISNADIRNLANSLGVTDEKYDESLNALKRDMAFMATRSSIDAARVIGDAAQSVASGAAAVASVTSGQIYATPITSMYSAYKLREASRGMEKLAVESQIRLQCVKESSERRFQEQMMMKQNELSNMMMQDDIERSVRANSNMQLLANMQFTEAIRGTTSGTSGGGGSGSGGRGSSVGTQSGIGGRGSSGGSSNSSSRGPSGGSTGNSSGGSSQSNNSPGDIKINRDEYSSKSHFSIEAIGKSDNTFGESTHSSITERGELMECTGSGRTHKCSFYKKIK